MDKRKATGQKGEDLALAYLLEQGYDLVARNYRCRLGEIDLIVQQGAYLVFVEVRSRRSAYWGAPEESIGRQKQYRIQRIAQYYLQQRGWEDTPFRFDVVTVDFTISNSDTRVKHIPAAFSFR